MDNNTGNDIKAAREKIGISQDKLAEIMGVSRQTVYRWEMNTATPSIDKLKKLCAVLHMELSEQLGFGDKTVEEIAAAENTETAAEKDVAAPKKRKRKTLYAIGIAVLSVIFLISLFFAYVIGLVIFDPAPGDVVINVYNYSISHFIICVIVSSLSLVAIILLSILIIKNKEVKNEKN